MKMVNFTKVCREPFSFITKIPLVLLLLFQTSTNLVNASTWPVTTNISRPGPGQQTSNPLKLEQVGGSNINKTKTQSSLWYAREATNNPNAVDPYPWIASAAFITKFCAIAKVAAVLIWGWVMTQLGIGTKEFYKEYFQLTTPAPKTTSAPITYGPSSYGANDNDNTKDFNGLIASSGRNLFQSLGNQVAEGFDEIYSRVTKALGTTF